MANPAEKAVRLDERLALVAEGMFTVTETGDFLRVSRSTVYTLMDNGYLTFVKVGRLRRIPKRAAFRFAASLLQGGASVHRPGT